MSEHPATACPPLSALLRLSDGETEPGEDIALENHLWRCESCRDRLAALEAIAEECVSAVVPVPGAESAGHAFLTGLQEHIRSKPVQVGTAKGWFTAAAAIPLVVLLLILSRSHTAVVQADMLVARALRAEEAMPELPAARVRWTSNDVGRARTYDAALAFDGTSARLSTANQTMVSALAPHGLDLEHPFSIKPFVSWRASLRHRRDVVREADDLIVLETATAEGAIRMAEVAVRRDTYVVVRVAFEFEDIGRVHIEPRGTADDDVIPVKSTEPGLPAVSGLEREELDYAELRARLALRAADLDLDERLRIVPSTSQTAVRMEGVTSAGQLDKLRELLSNVHRIELSIRAGAVAGTVDGPPVEISRELAGWLDRTYGTGDSEAKRRFVPALRRSVDLVGVRLAALNGVSMRYPPSAVRAMPAKHQALFKALIDEHYRAVNETLDACGGYVAVLAGETASLAIARTSAPRDWRSRTSRALQAARDMERLFGPESPLEPPQGEGVAPGSRNRFGIRTAFEQIWNDVNRR